MAGGGPCSGRSRPRALRPRRARPLDIVSDVSARDKATSCENAPGSSSVARMTTLGYGQRGFMLEAPRHNRESELEREAWWGTIATPPTTVVGETLFGNG